MILMNSISSVVNACHNFPRGHWGAIITKCSLHNECHGPCFWTSCNSDPLEWPRSSLPCKNRIQGCCLPRGHGRLTRKRKPAASPSLMALMLKENKSSWAFVLSSIALYMSRKKHTHLSSMTTTWRFGYTNNLENHNGALFHKTHLLDQGCCLPRRHCRMTLKCKPAASPSLMALMLRENKSSWAICAFFYRIVGIC